MPSVKALLDGSNASVHAHQNLRCSSTTLLPKPTKHDATTILRFTETLLRSNPANDTLPS